MEEAFAVYGHGNTGLPARLQQSSDFMSMHGSLLCA